MSCHNLNVTKTYNCFAGSDGQQSSACCNLCGCRVTTVGTCATCKQKKEAEEQQRRMQQQVVTRQPATAPPSRDLLGLDSASTLKF